MNTFLYICVRSLFSIYIWNILRKSHTMLVRGDRLGVFHIHIEEVRAEGLYCNGRCSLNLRHEHIGDTMLLEPAIQNSQKARLN